MELDHLHVAQREPRAIAERDAVGRFVGRTRHHLVHGRPATHRQEGRARGHDDEAAGAHVKNERARAAPRAVQQELDRPALLECLDVWPPEHLLGEPIHDLDAGEVALVDRAIVGLAGERLLVDPPLGRAVEEAAVARFELEHAPGRLHDQGPHELLIVDPAAAGERVEQVRVERVGLGQHGVVAALHHARTARASEQALHDDGDGQARRAIGRVERGAEPGAAGAEDQDIRFDRVDYRTQGRVTTGIILDSLAW